MPAIVFYANCSKNLKKSCVAISLLALGIMPVHAQNIDPNGTVKNKPDTAESAPKKLDKLACADIVAYGFSSSFQETFGVPEDAVTVNDLYAIKETAFFCLTNSSNTSAEMSDALDKAMNKLDIIQKKKMKSESSKH